jgi:hypothetical protein
MINNIKISGLPELTQSDPLISSGYTVIADGFTTYKISLQSLLSNYGGLRLTTTGTTGVATYDPTTNLLNIPDYQNESISGIYFVDKRYEGSAGAIVTGLALSGITSPNSTYNEQLRNAVKGSVSNPFPCPISARNKALQDIENGNVSYAMIIVLQGEWTFGSDNYMLNGNIDGSDANVHVVADLGFSAANNSTVASLVKNKVNYWFNNGTKLTYINSSYTLYHNYLNDNTDTEFNSGILGHLSVNMVYGLGYSSFFCKAMFFSNTRSKINLQYESFKMKPNLFIESQTLRSLNVKIKDFKGPDTIVFKLNTHKNVPDKYSTYNIEIDNLLSDVDPVYNTLYNAFQFTSFTGVTDETQNFDVNIKIKNANVNRSSEIYGAFINLGGNKPYNSNFTFNIDNLTHKSGRVTNKEHSIITIPFLTTRNFNCIIKFGTVVSEIPLIRQLNTCTLNSSGGYSSEENIKININVDHFIKKQNSILNLATPNNKYCLNLVESNYLTSLGGGMVNINGNFTTDDVVMYTRQESTGYTGNTNSIKISGVLKTTGSGKNVVIVDRSGVYPFLSFVDAFLVNDGSVDTIVNGSLLPLESRTIYLKNVGASSDVDILYITKVGQELIITPTLNKFIK